MEYLQNQDLYFENLDSIDYEEKPSDYCAFSIVTTLFLNFFIGLLAIYFSYKSRKMYSLKMYDHSRIYARYAFLINAIGVVIFVISLIVFVTTVIIVSSVIDSIKNPPKV
jgi:hypothetical protein